MSFMKDYKKRVDKNDKVTTELLPPQYFLHSGNYALNKLMSGNFAGGLPQGRLVMFAGHASSGKSLISASTVASVLNDGGFALVIDTESSLDDDFMRACGVDVDSDMYQYVGVRTIPEATAEVNMFIKMYRASGSTERGIIMVDSLDMLLTETESTRVDKDGDIGGDQGQQAKQVKSMLRTWVHSVTGMNCTIICTKQPYVEQDKQKAYEEPWKITESWQFAFSQILTFEKLNFKKEISGKKTHQGFTLKARTFKNRHAREKQVVKIEVPFESGVDPFSGLIEIAVEFGIVTKNGGWYTPVAFEGPKFQQKKAESDLEFMNMLLEEIKKVDSKDKGVNAELEDYVSELESQSDEPAVLRKRRQANAEKKAKEDTE